MLLNDDDALLVAVLIRVIQDANEGDEGGIKFDELHVQIDSNWRIAKDLDEFDMVLRLCMNADIRPQD